MTDTKTPDLSPQQRLGIVPLLFYGMFANAFVFMKLWQWFIYEYYEQYYISYKEACFVYFFIAFMKAMFTIGGKSKWDDPETYRDNYFKSISYPIIIFIFGFVFHFILLLIW